MSGGNLINAAISTEELEVSATITTEEPEIAATLSDLRYLVFQGLKGDTGEKGDPGFSPEIRVTDISGGHRLDIYNELGYETVNVMDGIDGTAGEDGADGVSPAVTVTEIEGGHRVTITDATHPQGQSFDVMDTQLVATIIDGDTLYVENMEVVENYDEEVF